MYSAIWDLPILVVTTKAANALDLWCPSSKTALSNSLSDTLGTEHLCHFRRQCQIRLLIIEPCPYTVAGSYSRCIMVIIFGQSVWVCQRGSMKHPWWNCATPSTDVLLHADKIEPSFAACATGGPGGIRTHVQN